MTLKKCEGKHRLNKLDMLRDKNFGSGKIKAKISTLSKRVSYENTWFKAKDKLVGRIGTKLGIAKTQFGVIRKSAKDFLKRRREIKGGSGHVVYKIGSSGKSMRQKVRGRKA